MWEVYLLQVKKLKVEVMSILTKSKNTPNENVIRESIFTKSKNTHNET